MTQLAFELPATVDQSGRLSRSGYYYQDLCALRYCITAASDGTWTEVWCESRDDIVLLRIASGGRFYRYVQVKLRWDAIQHWTCATLSEYPRRKTVSESILCKLLSRHHPDDPSDFRLVTNEGVGNDLRPFHYKWRHAEPQIDISCREARGLARKIGRWTPPRNTSITDLLSRFAVEQHAADADDMEAVLQQELARFLAGIGCLLLVDEIETVLQLLYAIVQRAATRDLRNANSSERIVGAEFRQRALEHALAICNRSGVLADSEPATTLQSELEQAGLPQWMIDQALQQRRVFYSHYRRELGTERGASLNEAVETVRAICMEEFLGVLVDGASEGGALLQRVLRRISFVHSGDAWQSRGIDLGVMHGICYFLISRGSFRLTSQLSGKNDE